MARNFLQTASDSDSEFGSPVVRERHFSSLPVVAVLGSAAAVGFVYALSTTTSRTASLPVADSSELLELSAFRGSAATYGQQQVQFQQRQMQQQQQQVYQQQQFQQQPQAPVQQTQSAVPPQAMAGALAVAPREHLHDGNPCADDEEFHAGLCYEKCSILTHDSHPWRQNAWSCCREEVCTPMHLLRGKCCEHHMGFCNGFDIAGMKEGNAVCPHKPGACLKDEELFLDICYMKCSILSQGKYPHRVAHSTCCATNDMSCLIDDKLQTGVHGKAHTDPMYSVGGGCGDGRNITKCSPHEPQQMLTESESR